MPSHKLSKNVYLEEVRDCAVPDMFLDDLSVVLFNSTCTEAALCFVTQWRDCKGNCNVWDYGFKGWCSLIAGLLQSPFRMPCRAWWLSCFCTPLGALLCLPRNRKEFVLD
jgi:hypothetical protein